MSEYVRDGQPTGIDPIEVRDELLLRFPNRCQIYGACGQVGMISFNIARKVVSGEIDMDNARVLAGEAGDEVNQKCPGGQTIKPEGFAPHPICHYGQISN